MRSPITARTCNSVSSLATFWCTRLLANLVSAVRLPNTIVSAVIAPALRAV